LASPHTCPLHMVWWWMLEGYPMMHHGARVVNSIVSI
jgi:hypothetical protein